MGIFDAIMRRTSVRNGSPLDEVTAPVGEETPLPTLTEDNDPAADAEPVPVYGADERGPAVRQEDVGGTESGDVGKLIRLARSFEGTPYVWGGSTPGGFDCSGLLQYVFRKVGVNLPRISYEQAQAGRPVPLGDVQPGDIIAWDNSSRNNGADHVALALGGGLILEAPRPGVPVRIRKLGADEGAWARRVL